MIHENGQSPYNYDVDPTEYEFFGRGPFGRGKTYRAIIGIVIQGKTI